ncbi:MAG: glycosyltransferase [Dokdonella sp.]
MRNSSTPVRVLMLLESPFPTTGGGGAESQVRTLALALRARGHEVTVLTPMLESGPQRTVDDVEGIPVRRISYPRIPAVGSLILWTRLAGFLFRNRNNFDAWHVHIAHYLGAIACVIGRWLGIPVIVKFSGQWELDSGLLARDASWPMRIAKGGLAKARVYQAISRRIAGEIVARGLPTDRTATVPNAVDVSRFQPRAGARDPALPFTAVYVGRLQCHKGLDTLVAAWAQAFRGRDDVRLELVGQGEDETALREQADAAGVANQIEFLGHRSDVENVLAAADVAVLPSLIEGLSNSLLEFMASGLPVIASRVSGSEDLIVTGSNGWLFDVGDRDGCANALVEAVAMDRDALAALGRQARLDVEAAAGLDGVLDRLLALYRGALPVEGVVEIANHSASAIARCAAPSNVTPLRRVG